MDAEKRLEMALQALEVIVDAAKEIKDQKENKVGDQKEKVIPATEKELDEVMEHFKI